MNRFFTLLLAASCLTAVGQVTYPYNPDGNADGDIAVGDLQDFLVTYGNPFSPSEILVDGETLTTVLTQLQNSIDSLSGLTGSGGSVLDMPLGTVLPIATESVPEGWMLCDGREISIEEYQGLYDLIGTTYGAGDSAFWAQVFYPATTFNIPDLRGRTIIGANNMGGEQSDVLAIHSASVGEVGGEEMHQLTEAEMPSHSHQVEIEGWDFAPPGGYDGFSGSQEVPTTSQEETSFEGGDQPHNNMQPYIALNYMMKVQAAEDVFAQLQATVEQQQSVLDSLINTECGNPIIWHGRSYETVSIFGNCWFAENLAYLPNVNAWSDYSEEEPRFYLSDYNGTDLAVAMQSSALQTHGVHYNHFAKLSFPICPTGWHVTSWQDWLNILPKDILGDPLFEDAAIPLIDPEEWPTQIGSLNAIQLTNVNSTGLNISADGRMYGAQDYYSWEWEDNWIYGLQNVWMAIYNSNPNLSVNDGSISSYSHTIRCVKN